MINSRTPKAAGLAALAFLMVTGCVSNRTTWHKPGTDIDQWSADSATCKLRAQRLAEDDYSSYSNYLGNGGIDESGGRAAMMRTYDARRNMQALFDQCLQRKGYRKGKPQPAKGKQA